MTDLKVLDPAMGSGHFLVEAVDFICNRILGQREGFLQAFPWNPVTTFLKETREEILAEMQRQEVTIDASRLTDVNLLKRYVLKRCVYGVDLNPMAVELAKVSLWLDCFTLGAPLSFLDHHLKCGNSLIGTAVQEVEAELASQKKGHAADLFGGPFQGLLSSTAMMHELARTPDVTVAESQKSRQLFADFEKSQAPYKAALDIWVSRHFGNALAQEYLTLVGRDYMQEIKTGGRNLSPQYRQVIEKAAGLQQEKRFFHWDLEFPEAYVDLERQAWKCKEEQGFDVVVGNPPYDVLATEELGYDVSPYLNYYKTVATYTPAIRGKTNLYKLFICKAAFVVAKTGTFSFIVPMALLGDDQSREVRRLLLEKSGLMAVDAFPQKDDPHRRVFPEAKLSTTVFVARGETSENPFSVRVHSGRYVEETLGCLKARPAQIFAIEPQNAPIPCCTQRDLDIATQVISRAKRLGEYCSASQGEVNETTDGKKGFISSDPKHGPQILRGSNICLYVLREPSQGEPIYLRKQQYLRGKAASSKAHHNQQCRVGWQESSAQNNFRRIIAAKIPQGQFCNHKINYVPESDCQIPLDLSLALLNSKISDWFFRLTSTNAAVSHYQIYALPTPYIVDVPVPSGWWQDMIDSSDWNKLAEALI
ncbi:MAG TPA: Eco57I restriction-modification methylase domain-containing protein, partial [Dehalococcoidia bacterium]|nr:Eco57I restriction-modification methylase domain-containing protein [Dehalococcoidia bacterium]